MKVPDGADSPDASARPERVRFVLVGTQSGGNVGSAARALKNLGFARLDLVQPRCDPRGPDAHRMAVDAADLLAACRIHERLDDALAGAATVVGLTARRGKHRRPHWRLDALADELAGMARGGELAFVLGREDHGLSDQELDRCTHLVYLPASESYSSFNLSQAVLLAAYELRLAAIGPAPDAGEPAAEHRTREAMYGHLEEALATIGFLQTDSREVIMRRIRRMLGRAGIHDEEVKLLRGVARQILWAADQAGLPKSPSGDPEID